MKREAIGGDASAAEAAGDDWLRRFHAGDRQLLADCYREHFAGVARVVGAILTGADAETAVHEVFFRLLDSEPARRSFQSGSFAAWIHTVARNHALDVLRRRQREVSSEALGRDGPAGGVPATAEWRAEARLLVERFCREQIPSDWQPLFEARFLRQLSQREAAVALGMRRTTLAYREIQIRRRLRRFLLKGAS